MATISRMIFISTPTTLEKIAKVLVKNKRTEFLDNFIGKATIFKSPDINVIVLDPANLSASLIYEEISHFSMKVDTSTYGILLEHEETSKKIKRHEIIGGLVPPFILAHFFNEPKKEGDDTLMSTLNSLDFIRPEDLSIQMSFETTADYVNVNINSKGLSRPVLTEKLNLMKARELHGLLETFIKTQEK